VSAPIIQVTDLALEFQSHRGTVHALNGISLEVREGEIVGLVGESGCGKSVTALALTRLLPERHFAVTAGQVRVLGKDPFALDEAGLQQLRGAKVATVFQEPMNALNPTMRIGPQIVEVIRCHNPVGAAEARRRAEQLLADMQIPDAARVMRSYPFELSGGMRQRVLIAMAFAGRPRLLIADEPTTALDVTVQAQILDLIRLKAREQGTAVLFISHDMAVVSQLCARVYVMYAGRIVESGRTRAVLERPQHPYTRALLQSLPDAVAPKQKLAAIPGTLPNLLALPPGCLFQPRCPEAIEVCARMPPLVDLDGAGHCAACWRRQPARSTVVA
jgi:oligopeptide/dipeptide ABC transporter ATP-binding protein